MVGAELGTSRLVVGADDADLQAAHRREVGPQAQHVVGADQLEPEPARPVVDPAGAQHPLASNPEGSNRPRQGLLVDLSGAQEAGGTEREVLTVAPELDQAEPALLDDASVGRRHTTGLEPRMGAPERRMPGEGQLLGRGEDPQAVVGSGLRCGLGRR